MCGFISELSILFRWSIFLFLYQHHTVSVTVALYSGLRSRSQILPALLFFLKIALGTHSLLCFHINFKNFLPVLNVKSRMVYQYNMVIYPCDYVPDWELWCAADAQHHNRVSYHVSQAWEKIIIKNYGLLLWHFRWHILVWMI